MRKSEPFLAALMAILLMLSPLTGCASGNEKQDAVIRLDEDGYLYYILFQSLQPTES